MKSLFDAASASRAAWALPHLDALVADLSTQGLCVLPNALPTDLTASLERYVRSIFSPRKIIGVELDPAPARLAGTGRAQDYKVNANIRGDRIAWLEPALQDQPVQRYVAGIEALASGLSQALFVSMGESEFMAACYPRGGFYAKHLDQHRSGSARVLSVICYLNARWQPSHGGELRVWLPDGRELLIEPRAGTLVVFRSDTIWHEVLPAKARRYSITGWLRSRV